MRIAIATITRLRVMGVSFLPVVLIGLRNARSITAYPKLRSRQRKKISSGGTFRPPTAFRFLAVHRVILAGISLARISLARLGLTGIVLVGISLSRLALTGVALARILSRLDLAGVAMSGITLVRLPLTRIALVATTWIVAHEVVPFRWVDVREHRASVMKLFRSGLVPKVTFFEIVADVSQMRRSDALSLARQSPFRFHDECGAKRQTRVSVWGKCAGAETIQESVPLHETASPSRLMPL